MRNKINKSSAKKHKIIRYEIIRYLKVEQKYHPLSVIFHI